MTCVLWPTTVDGLIGRSILPAQQSRTLFDCDIVSARLIQSKRNHGVGGLGELEMLQQTNKQGPQRTVDTSTLAPKAPCSKQYHVSVHIYIYFTKLTIFVTFLMAFFVLSTPIEPRVFIIH
jgi:hypothetical protein